MRRTLSPMYRHELSPAALALYEQWMDEQPYRVWTPERRAELRVAADREIARREAEQAQMVDAQRSAT